MDKLRFAYLCLGKHQNRLPNNANYLDCFNISAMAYESSPEIAVYPK